MTSRKKPKSRAPIVIEHPREFEPSRSPSIASGVCTPPLGRRVKDHLVRRTKRTPVMVDSSSSGSPPEKQQEPMQSISRKASRSASLRRSQSHIYRARSARVTRLKSPLNSMPAVTAAAPATVAADPETAAAVKPIADSSVDANAIHGASIARSHSVLLIRNKSTARGLNTSPIRQFFVKFFRLRKFRLLFRRRLSSKSRKSTYRYSKEQLSHQPSFEVLNDGTKRSSRFKPSKLGLIRIHPDLRTMAPSPASSSYSQRYNKMKPQSRLGRQLEPHEEEPAGQQGHEQGQRTSHSSRLQDPLSGRSPSALSALTLSTTTSSYPRSAGEYSSGSVIIYDAVTTNDQISARQGSTLRSFPSLKAPRPLRPRTSRHLRHLDQTAATAPLTRGISKRHPITPPPLPIIHRRELYSRPSSQSAAAAKLSPSVLSSSSSLFSSPNNLEYAIAFVDTWSQYLKRAIAVRVVLRQEIHSWEEENERHWRRSQHFDSDSVLSTTSFGSSDSSSRGDCSSCLSIKSSENWQRNTDTATARPNDDGKLPVTLLDKISAAVSAPHSIRAVNGKYTSELSPQLQENIAWFPTERSTTSSTPTTSRSQTNSAASRYSLATSSGHQNDPRPESEFASELTRIRDGLSAPSSATTEVSVSSIGSPTVHPLHTRPWSQLNSSASSSSASLRDARYQLTPVQMSPLFESRNTPELQPHNLAIPSSPSIPIRRVTGPRAMSQDGARPKWYSMPPRSAVSTRSNISVRDAKSPSSSSSLNPSKRRWSTSSDTASKLTTRRPLPPIPGTGSRSVSMPLAGFEKQQLVSSSKTAGLRRGGVNKRRTIMSQYLMSLETPWKATTPTVSSSSSFSNGSGSVRSSDSSLAYGTPVTRFAFEEEQQRSQSPSNPIIVR